MNAFIGVVRECLAEDIPSVTRIYAHYVLHSLATFEIEPPDAVEMERRWRNRVEKGFPYLLAERDGEVTGYAYAGPYRTRPAYRYTVENSVYVRSDCVGQGIGRRLMEALIDDCGRRGFRQMIAVIGDSENHASLNLHEALGFFPAGVLRSVGFKFGRWVDSVSLQRPLSAGDREPPA